MTLAFQGWDKVAETLHLRVCATRASKKPNEGQRNMLTALAARLPHHGVIIADEVGMGKTLVAVEVAQAVKACGGRVAILVPTGLGAQWQDELRDVGISTRDILRSLDSFCTGLERTNSASGTTWMDEHVVLISHTFANWRFSQSSSSWRYDLLPVMLGQWRKEQKNRFPHGYNSNNERLSCYVDVARRCIDVCKGNDGRCMAKRFEELAEIKWCEEDIYDGKNYSNGSPYRKALEKCVGMALGAFDLVIIDEAHKNRGETSGLSRCLDSMLLRNRHCRTLGMTATPVELACEQWENILQRIGADEKESKKALADSTAYVAAVNSLQAGAWRNDEEVINGFIQSANNFRQTMAPWVLRRSKAEDEDVQRFKILAKTDITHSYHCEKVVPVAMAELNATWQKAVCAAEALSLASRGLEDFCSQRLRLTIGSGHGIASLLDSSTKILADNDVQPDAVEDVQGPNRAKKKRLERVLWWQKLMQQNFCDQHVLYEHPAILEAIKRIEKITDTKEKVLVFGTYTRPLQALDDLLNARDMVRCFQKKISLPLETIPQDLKPAVSVALKQHGEKADIADVNFWLKEQYAAQSQQRKAFQESLVKTLEPHLSTGSSERVRELFEAMKNDCVTPEQGFSSHALVARALEEMLGERAFGEASSQDVVRAFEDLVGHVCTSDEGDTDHNGVLDAKEAHDLWQVIVDRLRQDYSSPRGSFSRMLFGQTAHASRRTAQLAFNRINSRLRVLVTQSRVGREGLNLHKACRHVLLLHPEWNPGVVEQQIGRVDRVGSYWAKLLQQYEECQSGEIPNIVLHCVVFKGTYDEHQWKVLNQRRLSLRAQFYGEILPVYERENLTDGEKSMLDKIIAATPSFSPCQADS